MRRSGACLRQGIRGIERPLRTHEHVVFQLVQKAEKEIRIGKLGECLDFGISQDDIQYIFERFYRCDRSRSQEGIGLGLSLARAIARAHGGDITFTSFPNQGSAFRVVLPKS